MATSKERRKKFRNLVVECPIQFYEQIDCAAHDARKTKSQFVRTAIAEYLAKEKKGE